MSNLNRSMKIALVAGFCCLGCLMGCPDGDDGDAGPSDGGSTNGPDGGPTPVFVTIAGHIEDSLIYTDCTVYGPKRDQLIQFADVIAAAGVDFNLQISYEWFEGASLCETEQLMSSTDGLNVIDYLVAEYDFEIDIHQEGASIEHASSGNNFADIRYMAGQVTDSVTETTGFQWDNQAQYAELQAGQVGLLHPEFTWQPEILAGGASVDHTLGDFSRDMTSVGVWIPSGFTEADFHDHDTSDEARMVYVGSGPNQFCADWNPMADCHFTNTADFVGVLVDYLETGRLESNKIYTTTLFIPQSIIFDPTKHDLVNTVLQQLNIMASAGQVEYAHFTEVVDTWRTQYNSVPNIVQYDRIDPADYTCGQ
jgi:hypothetical protein